MTDDFDATLATGLSLIVTTADGGGIAVPIYGTEDINPPMRSFKEDKYIPLTGPKAGKEQVILCSEEASEVTVTFTYNIANQVAMDAQCGVNGCQIVMTLADGLVMTGRGGMKKLGLKQLVDSKRITGDLTLCMAGGWSLASGASPTIVQPYLVSMVTGAKTIDLSACGSAGTINLTGKKVVQLVLTAPAGNANAVTVATGGTNGYDISIQVLNPGQSVTLQFTSSADVIGSTKKTLDVTGTGAQGVIVSIAAA